MSEWIYEDELPAFLTDEQYDKLYPLSRIIMGVRMFPRREVENETKTIYRQRNKTSALFSMWEEIGATMASLFVE